MLEYAQAVLKAEKDPSNSQLKHIPMLLSNQILLNNSSHNYQFYGMGWICTQLPGVVGLQDKNTELFDKEELPVLGPDSCPMMAYYHQGTGIGYYSAIFLFPKTKSTVVVLTNSMLLSDAANWIAQVYMSVLFDFSNITDYIKLAKESHRQKLSHFNELKSTFDKIQWRNPSTLHLLYSYKD